MAVAAQTAGAAPAAEGTGCSVSTLLVPSCGAWLGASTPSRDGSYDYDAGMSEYLAVAGNVPDIIHFYKTGGATFPTSGEVALSKINNQQVSLLFYNWKPSTSVSWGQIADGAADDNIRTVANGLKRYPGRLFLAIHHEPENDQGAAGSGRTPADYVAMYRHVVTMLRAEGVTNVVFVMNFMGFSKWASVADDFYPGDDVVDWIAYDPYAYSGQATFSSLLNQPAADWPGFYNWVVVHAPGKPIMLAEWGFDLESQSQAPAALDGAAAALQTRFPMLKALVYWNNKGPDRDFRLDQNTALGQQYGAAYSRMANASYFNSTGVSGPVVDAPDAPLPAGPQPSPDPVAGGQALDPPPEIPEFPLPAAAVGTAVLVGWLVLRRQRRADPVGGQR